MSLLSLNKVKLFKAGEIQPRRPAPEPSEEEKERPPFIKILKSPRFLLVVTVVLVALFLSYRPSKTLPVLKAGEIAPADIVAPHDLIVEDAEATAQKRADAENAVIPVYTYDPNVFANAEDKIRRLFQTGREWNEKNPTTQTAPELRAAFLDALGVDLDQADTVALIRLKFPAELEEILVSLAEKLYGRGIILSKNLFTHEEPERGLSLLDQQRGERTVQVGQILDLKQSEELFDTEVEKLELPARSRTLLKNMARIFLTPNVTYNKIETENRKTLARAGVPVVTYTIKKGRIIIRKGDEATLETIRVLDLFNQRLQRRASWLPEFAASFLLYLMLFFALWLYLNSIQKSDRAETSFRMAALFELGSLALYKISLALATAVSAATAAGPFARVETYYYAFPFQVGALLFAFLSSDQVALAFVILNCITVGYLLGANFYLMIFTVLGGLAAIYGIRLFKSSQRVAALRTGLLVIPPVNFGVLLIFQLIERQGGLGFFAAEVLMGILGGVTSASIAFLLLPAVESAFGFITSTKLLELMNSDLPIFKQMALEAPGTYHHSLVVATLAEKAAEELGLDAQLARAGGLYHDIGKTRMPEYFIENRDRDFDLHKGLKPSMSTLVIINHVKEGSEIARKMKLPRPLREMIEQHHGSSLVRYFYIKAKQVYDPDQQKIGEEDYRYPGPPPQTKETALVMLADSVEAASRSLRAPTKDNLKRVITDIFNAYLQDGQLDACDFSLRELRAVASTFLSILFAIYHPRVEYPGFEFEVRKSKKPNNAKSGNNGRNHQHSE